MIDKESRDLKTRLNNCSRQELRDLMHQLGHLDFNWSVYQTVNLQFHGGIAVWKSGDKWCALHPKADTSSWYCPAEGRIDADCHQCTGDSQGTAIVRAYLCYKLRANMPKGRTSAVFYIQGECSARSGNARSPGNEYRMPKFGMGKSWQAKAFARGFRDYCAKIGVTVIDGD